MMKTTRRITLWNGRERKDYTVHWDEARGQWRGTLVGKWDDEPGLHHLMEFWLPTEAVDRLAIKEAA